MQSPALHGYAAIAEPPSVMEKREFKASCLELPFSASLLPKHREGPPVRERSDPRSADYRSLRASPPECFTSRMLESDRVRTISTNLSRAPDTAATWLPPDHEPPKMLRKSIAPNPKRHRKRLLVKAYPPAKCATRATCAPTGYRVSYPTPPCHNRLPPKCDRRNAKQLRYSRRAAQMLLRLKA